VDWAWGVYDKLGPEVEDPDFYPFPPYYYDYPPWEEFPPELEFPLDYNPLNKPLTTLLD